MLNSKKDRVLFVGVLVIIILFAVAGIIFIYLSSRSSQQRPVSLKDQLFYVNQNGLFSYDVATGKTWQIFATNASTSIFNGQRIGDDAIGFEVGQAYSDQTSSVYMFDLASDTLTRETDIGGDAGWYVDNFALIAPGEFAYTEANATASMIDNYDRVFLFKNGTTTQIGYISNPGEYGSTMSSAPDGKHLFFANEIYDMATGSWIPVTAKCHGPESAWLNDDVVVLKWESDYNAGDVCDYDITSGTESDVVGVANGFDVMDGNILYMDTAPALPGLFQISQYDYATHVVRVIVPNARLWSYYHYDMDGFPGVVYQPMVSSGTCFTLDCFGGIASGSFMTFNPATGRSTPLGFGSLENITDIF
jgi:hypothetical protein